METNNKNRVETAKTDHLAMEMLKNERRTHKAKDIGIVCLTVLSAVIAIGLSIINYKNDCDWRLKIG